MSIKPDRDDINGIFDKIISGEISIPTFQRDFVWSNTQIKDFFDSILKGYPIGSLILWSPTAEKFRTLSEIGRVNIEASTSSPVIYVLDGRQRLTTLISVLHPSGCNFDKFYLNLDTYTVEYWQHQPKTIEYTRLGDLYNTYTIVDYIESLRRGNLSNELVQKYSENAKRANRTLLTYYLGYIYVKGGSIKEAVEIFSRLNSQGSPISEDYMLQALAYDHDSDFLLASRITDIKDKLVEYNFAGLKRDTIFNCLYNYIDIPFIDGEIKDLINHINRLPEIVDRLGEDMTKAVRFLYKECGVIDYRLLPYSYQIIMLCMYFSTASSPTPHDLRLLKEWFLYTTYAAYFTSHSLSEIRADILRFKRFAKRECDTPIDFSTDGISLELPSRINMGSVRSCAYVITSLLQAPKRHEGASTLIIRKIYPGAQKTFENCIICSSIAEYNMVMDCLNGRVEWTEDMLAYGISRELVDLYLFNRMTDFLGQRKALIISNEEKSVKALF